jgi:hypothetical protein
MALKSGEIGSLRNVRRRGQYKDLLCRPQSIIWRSVPSLGQGRVQTRRLECTVRGNRRQLLTHREHPYIPYVPLAGIKVPVTAVVFKHILPSVPDSVLVTIERVKMTCPLNVKGTIHAPQEIHETPNEGNRQKQVSAKAWALCRSSFGARIKRR